MDNLPRFIFYASGVVLISAAIILFTSDFLPKVNDPSYIGMLFLLGYGFVYMNLVFASSRRFMRRLNGPSASPFIFAFLIAIPPIAWVTVSKTQLGPSFWIFIITILLACGLGALFGHKAGLKSQIIFQKNLKEYLEQDERIPDDLKRPHDNLNKN